MKKIVSLIPFCLLLFTASAMAFTSPQESTSKLEITGTVEYVSALPDAKKSPYPEWYFSAIVKVVISDDTSLQNKRIIIFLHGIKEGKLTELGKLTKGDKLKALLVPYEEVEESITSLSVADSVEEFDLDSFYSFEAAILTPYFSGSEIKNNLYDIYTGSKSREEYFSRQQDIIDKQLKKFNGDWWLWHKQSEKFVTSYNKTLLKKGWKRGFLWGPYLLDKNKKITWHNGAIDFLVQFKKDLENRGIKLIVVPQPGKSLAMPGEELGIPKDLGYDTCRYYLMQKLMRSGIDIIDLVPIYRSKQKEFSPIFHDDYDDHLAGGGIHLTALVLAQRVASLLQLPQARKFYLDRTTYTTKKRPPYFNHEYTYPATRVLDAELKEIVNHEKADVVFIADSTTYAPQDFGITSANVAVHLHRLTGLTVRNINNLKPGNFATRLARSKKDLQALRNAKIVIYMAHSDRFFFYPKPEQYDAERAKLYLWTYRNFLK